MLAGAPQAHDWSWCEAMLPQVSRTFALCIRFLPAEVRRAVLLSYLLCRIADTIEDAGELDGGTKARLLGLFAGALADGGGGLLPLAEALNPRDDPDARLVAEAQRVCALLATQPATVRAAVVTWVGEMCRGMAEFAAAAPADEGGAALRSLQSEADLDRYCYFVAGTVGHLLTALFAAMRPRITPAAGGRLDALAEDFGAGLQLVNILVDVARDRQRGVCYVPESVCQAAGLAVDDLLRPELKTRARQALQRISRRAHERLDCAREYCLQIPRAEYQLRLFCLIPYLLALRTLRALDADARYPLAGQRVKIGRPAVYRTVAAARFCAASNRLLRVYARRLDPADRASQTRRA